MSGDFTFITNDSAENTLSGRLNTLLKQTEYFDVLVGYFFTSGFYTMYKSLENVEKIRILIGISTDYKTYSLMEESKNPDLRVSTDKTKELFSKRVIEELDNSEDSIDIEEGILKFIDWLQKEKLEIKTYPYDRIHAKVYIMTFNKDSPDDGRVITGSSNFTSAGLNNNLEFNVELKNSSDYKFSKEKFEELWEQAVDVSEEYVETVKKDTWLNENITPYELYLKFLYEYLKDKINLDQALIDKYIPPGFLDLQYQKDAVIDAKSKLDQYGGVFLSDVVGVGKTYISALLAQQLDGKTLIIAPPVLLDEGNPGSWPNVFRDFGVRSWKAESWGKLDKLIEDGVEDYKNVFVDEAHLFRNAKSQRYSKLAQVCRGKRVILVTATPLNNTPYDILSQIGLFQSPNNSTLPNPKVKNLSRYFSKLDKRLRGLDRQKDKDTYIQIVKENSQMIREDVLQHIMVRRTRSSIEKYYSKDLEEQGLKFLEVNDPVPIGYNFNKNLNNLFDETLKTITQNLTYARYMPLLYLKIEDPEMKAPQTNMGRFMKGILVKRLESSFYAFKKSVGRFIGYYENFIASIDSGYVYFSKKDMDKIFEYLENDDEESIEILIEKEKAERYEIDLFDKDKLIADLKHDLDILRDLDYKWKDVEDDPKLSELINKLIHEENLQNKIILFTESKETAEYIAMKLNPLFENKVLCFTGSSDRRFKRVVNENFDAKARVQKDDYRILVTTDILAEGVNLHRSNVVINYDIPWNPTKLMQRVGRIQRVGSEFDEVFIYNFFPAGEINENLGLEEAAESKINAFIEMLGNDAKLLTDEEIKAHDLFEKLNSKTTINGEDEEEDTELKYLYKLREIRDNDVALFERIKRIPKKARSSKLSTEEGLLTFVRKGKMKKIYLNKGKDISELDLFKAAELLECEEDTERLNIPRSFYELLDGNKKEFEQVFKEEDSTYSKVGGRSKVKELQQIVRGLKRSRFTDKDEQYVEDLLNAIEDGVIPHDIAKKTIDSVNKYTQSLSDEEFENLDHLRVLNIVRKNVPPVFVYHCPVTSSANIFGRREVIISEYLQGD